MVSTIGLNRSLDQLIAAAPTKTNGSEQLVARTCSPKPLVYYIPNPDSMTQDLRLGVANVPDFRLELRTNARAEEIIGNGSSREPLVVVIVPTYNCESFIVEALDSIARQRYPEILVAVIDDHSTDRTVSLVLRFMNEHASTLGVIFTSIPHFGNPALTRNIGLYNLVPSRAAYFAFMDGDDLYADDEAIGYLVDALQREPTRMGAFGDYDWIGEDGSLLAPPSGITKHANAGWRWRDRRRLTWENIAEGNLSVFHLQCLMVRRGAPFLPYRPRGEDVQYYAMLIGLSSPDSVGQIDALLQLPKLISHYRRHSTSYSYGAPVMRVEEHGSKRRRFGGEELPWLYEWTRLPSQYINTENLSKYTLRKHLRECTRALVNRDWRNALVLVRRAYRDPRVLRRHLLTLPASEFLVDPSTRSTLRHVSMKLWRRVSKPPIG